MKVKVYELFPDGRKADSFIELEVANVNSPVAEIFQHYGFNGQFAAINYFRTRRDDVKKQTFITYSADGNKDYWVVEDVN